MPSDQPPPSEPPSPSNLQPNLRRAIVLGVVAFGALTWWAFRAFVDPSALWGWEGVWFGRWLFVWYKAWRGRTGPVGFGCLPGAIVAGWWVSVAARAIVAATSVA